jgi:hypothetical protein
MPIKRGKNLKITINSKHFEGFTEAISTAGER